MTEEASWTIPEKESLWQRLRGAAFAFQSCIQGAHSRLRSDGERARATMGHSMYSFRGLFAGGQNILSSWVKLCTTVALLWNTISKYWLHSSRRTKLYIFSEGTKNNFKVEIYIYIFLKSPDWCGSVDWVSACEAKGHWFNSQSEHMPGLQARSPVGGLWEETTCWCFSLFPYLPLYKSK